jgi:hypothetical protein
MWKSLPLEIRLVALGVASMVLLMVAAVAARPPTYLALEDDAPASADVPPPPSSESSASSGKHHAAPLVAERHPAGTGTANPPRGEPTSTAAPPPSGDARELRSDLRKDVQFGRYGSATDVLARLLEADPDAPKDSEVRGDIVELSMRVMLLTGGEPDRVFEMISTKMDTTGVDILYELLTTRGGSRAAARAEELLRDEKVRSRGTPAVRIAYELRVAQGCSDKKALFDRAKSDGDGRTLGQLQLLNRRCRRRSGNCCLENDPELRDAIDTLKARLN